MGVGRASCAEIASEQGGTISSVKSPKNKMIVTLAEMGCDLEMTVEEGKEQIANVTFSGSMHPRLVILKLEDKNLLDQWTFRSYGISLQTRLTFAIRAPTKALIG